MMQAYTEAERAELIEDLEEVIKTETHSVYGHAARIALAALTAEPAAYMYRDKLHSDARFSLYPRFGNWSPEDIDEYEITETRLYTTPPVAAPALHTGFDPAGGDEKTVIVHHLAPPGWKLVPVEPTRQMMSQGHFALGGTDRGKFRRIYQAMLAAAPSPSDHL